MAQKGTDHSREIGSLKKIEGQIRGLIKMVEDERYCIDILNQFKAVFAALESVETKVLVSHIDDCIRDAVIDDEKKAKYLLNELSMLLKKTGRKK